MLDLPTPIATPANEPILSYAPGSPERAALKSALGTMAKERPDVPHYTLSLHDALPIYRKSVV